MAIVSWPVLLILQMGIGALIGGVTNELAIRMLFRPYKPVYIGKWKIPFTPGLIPKRHDELALQMGRLVENFLITPQGVRAMLQKGQVGQEIQQWLHNQVNELSISEETVHDLMKRWGMPLNEELGERAKHQLVIYLSQRITQSSYLTLDEILSDELKNGLEQKIADAAPFFLDKMSRFLGSEEGETTIKQMLSQLSGGLGMFGGLASMLLSDEKVIAKVSSSLEASLRNEELQDKLAVLLQREFRGLYGKQVGEIIQWVGHEKVEQTMRFLVDRIINIDRIGSLQLKTIIEPIKPYLEEVIPSLVASLLSWIEAHLEEGLKKINLTKIAATQVEAFPVHKLEEMIISITGKELKMITVFGAILGGLIGAVQGMLVFFMR